MTADEERQMTPEEAAAFLQEITEWRIVKVRTVSHGFIAVAPGCPTDRHPTRYCRCRIFVTRAQAREYSDAERRDPQPPDRGTDA